MRVLICMALLMSFSALAQTRVRENIKQKAVATSEDGSSTKTKVRPAKKSRR